MAPPSPALVEEELVRRGGPIRRPGVPPTCCCPVVPQAFNQFPSPRRQQKVRRIYSPRRQCCEEEMANTTPICRCRVLYLGSSVPHITKDGLQGIQEPLRELYPDQGPFTAKGIDSWLSVWSNGLLLENVDESRRQITRFFPIESLHYCAAVRYVVVPGNGSEKVEKFLPLDSPFAKHAVASQPPLFACILRRTTGIKVLECHAFIAKKEAAANALVRCCFHAYADSMYARQLEENPYYVESKRGPTTVERVEEWRQNGDHIERSNGNGTPSESAYSSGRDDENYKVWTGTGNTERELVYMDEAGTLRSVKSNSNGTSQVVATRSVVFNF